MTVPDLDGHAAALRAVVDVLDDAVTGTASVATEVAASWGDGVGAGWAARLDLVRRELARQTGVAAELMRVVDALTGDVDAPEHADTGPTDAGDGPPTAGRPGEPGVSPPPGAPPDSRQGWSLPGVRLGGTDGTRATERRGVVVPTLPDQSGG